MRPVRYSRKPIGAKDLFLIGLITIVLVIALIYLMLKIIGQSETHVEKVRKTKLKYEESLDWREGKELSTARVVADFKANPKLKKANYAMAELSEKAFKYIGKMEKLEELILTDSSFEEDSLKHITRLPLVKLDLYGTKITDAAVPYLVKIETLKWLSIGNTEITDASLESISKHRKIENLNLHATKITNRGLKSLKSMKSLENLNIGRTAVTTECLQSVAGIEGLKDLNMEGIHISADQLSMLCRLKSFGHLSLNECMLKDADLESIGKLKNLQTLKVCKNDLTDKSMVYIGGLPLILNLEIMECPNVSVEAVNRFKKAHPYCQVKYSVEAPAFVKDFKVGNMKEEVKLIEDHVQRTDLSKKGNN